MTKTRFFYSSDNTTVTKYTSSLFKIPCNKLLHCEFKLSGRETSFPSFISVVGRGIVGLDTAVEVKKLRLWLFSWHHFHFEWSTVCTLTSHQNKHHPENSIVCDWIIKTESEFVIWAIHEGTIQVTIYYCLSNAMRWT